MVLLSGRNAMLKNIALYILVLIFLFACATPEKYDAELASMIGEKSSVLVEKWGKPSARKILAGGDEVYTYTKAGDIYVPSEFYMYNQEYEPGEDVVYYPFLNDYDFGSYGATFGYQVEEFCQTSFLIKNGLISGWKWRGNDCLSY